GCFDGIGAGGPSKLQPVVHVSRLQNDVVEAFQEILFGTGVHVQSVSDAIALDIIDQRLFEMRVVMAVVEGAGASEEVEIGIAVYVVQPAALCTLENDWKGTGVALNF